MTENENIDLLRAKDAIFNFIIVLKEKKMEVIISVIIMKVL